MLIPTVNHFRYTARAVAFDSSTYLTRGSDFTSDADGKKGIFSAWVNLAGNNGSTCSLFTWANIGYGIDRLSSNVWRVIFGNSANSTILSMSSNTTYTTSSGWVHLLASWDLASTYGKLYINDADDLAAGATITNDTIDYTRGSLGIGATTTGGQKLIADVADLYFNDQESIDITVTANRRLFISGALKPVDLGPDGSAPTGSQPRLYLKGPASAFTTNLGSGGNFSVAAGALTDSTTRP